MFVFDPKYYGITKKQKSQFAILYSGTENIVLTSTSFKSSTSEQDLHRRHPLQVMIILNFKIIASILNQWFDIGFAFANS